MSIHSADLAKVSYAMFVSNKASLGGAVYISAVYIGGVEQSISMFGECIFESNEAADGGAVYLYTGTGVDIFTASAFRDNFAGDLPRITSICEIGLPNA